MKIDRQTHTRTIKTSMQYDIHSAGSIYFETPVWFLHLGFWITIGWAQWHRWGGGEMLSSCRG